MNEVCLYDLEGAEYTQVEAMLYDMGTDGCPCQRCYHQGLRVHAKTSKAYDNALFLPALKNLEQKPQSVEISHHHVIAQVGDIKKCVTCGFVPGLGL